MVRKLLFVTFIGLVQHFYHTEATPGQCQGNIIKAGITAQSTDYTSQHTSDRAIDRIQDKCSHTQWQGNPWWRIDLQGLFEVSCINISNIDNAVDMTGSEIFIGNSTEGKGIKCSEITTSLKSQDRSYPCSQPILGRYITVKKVNNGTIVLCEVSIYGTKKESWKLIRENKTWEEALHYCRDRNMELVSVLDNNIQAYVALEAQKADSPFVWLGLCYSCSLKFWFWADSLNLCYRRWAPGNELMKQCFTSAAMETKGNHDWFVRLNNERFNFICQS